MQIGASLPVRELRDDLAAIRDFASLAEELGFTHLRIPEQIARQDSSHLHHSGWNNATPWHELSDRSSRSWGSS
jgi:hypothetical protein